MFNQSGVFIKKRFIIGPEGLLKGVNDAGSVQMFLGIRAFAQAMLPDGWQRCRRFRQEGFFVIVTAGIFHIMQTFSAE